MDQKNIKYEEQCMQEINLKDIIMEEEFLLFSENEFVKGSLNIEIFRKNPRAYFENLRKKHIQFTKS